MAEGGAQHPGARIGSYGIRRSRPYHTKTKSCRRDFDGSLSLEYLFFAVQILL